MKINLVLLLLTTVLLYLFTTYMRDVPVWVQSNWRWDQAQWMLLQLTLSALWTLWLVGTVLTFFIKRDS